MKTFLVLILVVVIQCKYPIMIYGTDLGRSDLFITQDALIERLAQQSSKKIHIFNVQTLIEESDLFINQLKSKSEQMMTFKNLFLKSFISSYIQYDNLSEDLAHKDLEVKTTQVNLQNLNNIEKTLNLMNKNKNLKDSILIITFSLIKSNLKLLQEIDTTNPNDIIAAQTSAQTSTDATTETNTDATTDTNTDTTVTADATGNQVFAMTSNQLSGLLVFLPLLLTIWIAVSCLMSIETPERFVKTTYHYGKEN